MSRSLINLDCNLVEVKKVNKRYGILNFLFDLFMISLTGGLWLLWIVLRYLRRR